MTFSDVLTGGLEGAGAGAKAGGNSPWGIAAGAALGGFAGAFADNGMGRAQKQNVQLQNQLLTQNVRQGRMTMQQMQRQEATRRSMAGHLGVMFQGAATANG